MTKIVKWKENSNQSKNKICEKGAKYRNVILIVVRFVFFLPMTKITMKIIKMQRYKLTVDSNRHPPHPPL